MSRPIPVEEMVRQFTGYHSHSHIFRIDNFSLFDKYQNKEIESSVFVIGSQKWRLVVYPNGNENDNGRGHVSLYLETQEAGSPSWSVKIRYQLFVLYQFRPDWREQGGYVSFDASNRKRGFPRLISVAEFGNPRNGFLVDGTALFGVKFLDIAGYKAGTTDRITMTEKPLNIKISWKMMKFSALDRYEEYQSEEFIIENRKWKLSVYPRGSSTDSDTLAVYLRGGEFISNILNGQTFVHYKIRVLDQKNKNDVTQSFSHSLLVHQSGHGTNAFMPLKDLQNPSNYVVNDTLYVEVEGVGVGAISITT